MQKLPSVGKSSRTPYKHWLYSSMLGKMIGAASTGKSPCNGTIKVLDMCAGDGVETNGDALSSSPAIACHHITSVFHNSHRVQRSAFLYERELLTFEKLHNRFGSKEQMTLRNLDSKGVTTAHIDARPGDGVFVYADPNSVSTLPVTEELIESFTDTTLFLMTLGCNVGGVKRLGVNERVGWMDVVMMTVENMRPWHDIHILSLNRDDSQWAYLAAWPRKWSDDFLQSSIRKGNQLWPNGVSAFSARNQERQFRSKIEELFYTQKELSERNQQLLLS